MCRGVRGLELTTFTEVGPLPSHLTETMLGIAPTLKGALFPQRKYFLVPYTYLSVELHSQ